MSIAGNPFERGDVRGPDRTDDDVVRSGRDAKRSARVAADMNTHQMKAERFGRVQQRKVLSRYAEVHATQPLIRRPDIDGRYVVARGRMSLADWNAEELGIPFEPANRKAHDGPPS
jgi:hypothetical protein